MKIFNCACSYYKLPAGADHPNKTDSRKQYHSKKNLAEEKPCKASLGYSSASRTLEVAIYAEYYKLSSRLYKISSINENQTTKYQKQ
jgi:hypothetical protein